MPKKVMDLRRLVEYLQILGPRNVSALAREIGHHPETVRYWMKKLTEMGFRCVPVIASNKLGLRPIIAFIKLSRALQGFEGSFAKLMAEVAYCVYFGRTLFDKNLIMYFYFPADKIARFFEFMDALQENGLIESYRAYVAKNRIALPFRPEFFDFQHGAWTINWKELNGLYPLPTKEDSEICEIDPLDLKIVKAMQIDPTIELTELRIKLEKKLTLKTLLYHYKAHVVANGIIPTYSVIWTGEPAVTPAHRVLYPKIWFEDLTYSEFTAAATALSLLPFSWSLFYSEDRDFVYAEAHIPQYHFIEAATWLTEKLDYALASKARISLVDRNWTSAFALPDFMYDGSRGEWSFQTELALKASQMLSQQIKDQK